MKRRALITGITGQDGSYLAEFLLEKDYEVFGLIRRTSTNGLSRIQHLKKRLTLMPGDLTDMGSLTTALRLANPHEVYNLAAQSYVGVSFTAPSLTAEVTGLGALKLFEAVRLTCPSARVYQASSSEQFGNSATEMQSETTPFSPVSPYGVAKAFAHHMARVHQRSYHMFIACGIAFNHESERRGEEFVSRKISLGVARIKRREQFKLSLGDIHPERDWCHASDIVRGAWMMLQQPLPGEYILASGIKHSIKDFAQMAFHLVGLEFEKYLVFDETMRRPVDIRGLRGDITTTQRELGWTPTVSFEQLVQRMVNHDLNVNRDLNAVVADHPE